MSVTTHAVTADLKVLRKTVRNPIWTDTVIELTVRRRLPVLDLLADAPEPTDDDLSMMELIEQELLRTV
jgi:hypothetical protein